MGNHYSIVVVATVALGGGGDTQAFPAPHTDLGTRAAVFTVSSLLLLSGALWMTLHLNISTRLTEALARLR